MGGNLQKGNLTIAAWLTLAMRWASYAISKNITKRRSRTYTKHTAKYLLAQAPLSNMPSCSGRVS